MRIKRRDMIYFLIFFIIYSLTMIKFQSQGISLLLGADDHVYEDIAKGNLMQTTRWVIAKHPILAFISYASYKIFSPIASFLNVDFLYVFVFTTIGALNIVFFRKLLVRLGRRGIESDLFTILFGTSFSVWILSSMSESAITSCLLFSIFIIYLQKNKNVLNSEVYLRQALLLIIAVLAFITNLILMLAPLVFIKRINTSKLKNYALFIITVVIVSFTVLQIIAISFFHGGIIKVYQRVPTFHYFTNYNKLNYGFANFFFFSMSAPHKTFNHDPDPFLGFMAHFKPDLLQYAKTSYGIGFLFTLILLIVLSFKKTTLKSDATKITLIIIPYILFHFYVNARESILYSPQFLYFWYLFLYSGFIKSKFKYKNPIVILLIIFMVISNLIFIYNTTPIPL